jgi:two-component system chemotaxis response regulator CheB
MSPKNIVIIGSSAGGPRILNTIFHDLPRLDGCIIIVQHMPKFINDSLRQSLSRTTRMAVEMAKDGDVLESGKAYVAPSEVHMGLVKNQQIRLYFGEKRNYVCPSVDVTMESVVRGDGLRFIGIVLSGMGRDGADGIRYLKKIGGYTIAQDEKSSVIFGMPQEAIKTGSVDWILTPVEIQKKLIELIGIKVK